MEGAVFLDQSVSCFIPRGSGPSCLSDKRGLCTCRFEGIKAEHLLADKAYDTSVSCFIPRFSVRDYLSTCLISVQKKGSSCFTSEISGLPFSLPLRSVKSR